MKEEIETPTFVEVTNFDIKYLLPQIKQKGRKKKGWFTEKRIKRFIKSKTEITRIFHNPSTENIIKELLSYLKEDPDSPDFFKNTKTKIQDLAKFYRDFNKNKRKIKERIEQLQNELLETEEEAELEKEKTRLEEEKHTQEMQLSIIKAMLKKIEEKMNEISRKKKELAYLQAQEQKARLVETMLQLTKSVNYWIKYCDCRKKKLNIEDVIKIFLDWKKESRVNKAQEETIEIIRQLEKMNKKIDKQLEELKEVKICM